MVMIRMESGVNEPWEKSFMPLQPGFADRAGTPSVCGGIAAVQLAWSRSLYEVLHRFRCGARGYEHDRADRRLASRERNKSWESDLLRRAPKKQGQQVSYRAT